MRISSVDASRVTRLLAAVVGVVGICGLSACEGSTAATPDRPDGIHYRVDGVSSDAQLAALDQCAELPDTARGKPFHGRAGMYYESVIYTGGPKGRRAVEDCLRDVDGVMTTFDDGESSVAIGGPIVPQP